eukprot:NODE_1391_length_1155_cov_288.530000.p2 GENE.NODE_1391_length_1155_cov_288.530000~~NODE_1391_length_1155_cov_288.530000.p2  ORF type:complete len:257 (+),score=107.82 NODE_1391_length_1155_cov_288.530000:59-829(+)
MEEDVKQVEADQRKQLKAAEETLASMREELAKQKADAEVNFEKHGSDLLSHAKTSKVQEIAINSLQSTVVSDLNDLREQLRTDRASGQAEIQDARAVGARAALNNENSIQAVVNEIVPLRQFRELLVDRLQVEKHINIVREWQAGHVPHVSCALKDLEERSRKLVTMQSRDHEVIVELQKATAAIRGHFKMFHAIAAGLDDKPMPSSTYSVDGGGSYSDVGTPRLWGSMCRSDDDTRLPPISFSRGSQSPAQHVTK